MSPTACHPIDPALGLLVCPVCRSAFDRIDRTLRCESGHSFDLARQGYVNLMGQRAPRNADTTEMAAARDRFLATGAYRPIREAVVARCESAHSVVEVGAGTGYYLCGVVGAHHPESHLAVDVSAAAARRSAGRALASAVADIWAGIPVRTGTTDRLVCVFAPRNPREFIRLLAPGGRLIVVTPGPRHLAELRHQLGLLDVPEDKLARLDTSLSSVGLHLADRTHLEFEVTLSPKSVTDLVAMGPNAFHQRPAVVALSATVQVAVTVSEFRARKSQAKATSSA